MIVKVLKQLGRYDAQRSTLSTFVSRIADSELTDYFRRNRAAKRDSRRNGRSLNEDVRHRGGRSCQLVDLIDDNDRQSHLGRRCRPQAELDALAIDLKEALSKLPPESRQLLEVVAAESVPEAARRFGVSRGTVYRRLQAIRLELQDTGLAYYLDQGATDSSKLRM